MKKILHYKEVIFVILISLLPLFSLFTPGLPVTHDGQDHVARIANFYLSLSEGNLVPRWAANLNWGYGHPILMFLYPFSSYFASFFHFIGFSFVDSLKIIFGLGFTLSGVFMFLWVRNFSGNIAGIVAAILYMFAPYRFIDLYVRGAIGEHMAFIFPPLILYFLLKISNSKYNFWYLAGGAISISLFILSHNAISIMFLPFLILYAVYLLFNTKKNYSVTAQFVTVFLLGFGLSSFFLIPAFIEGKYTLRDIVTGSEALSRFVKFPSLVWGPWVYGITGQFTVQLGIIQWLFVLATPIAIYKMHKARNKQFLLLLLALITLFSSIFLMLKESEFIWRIVTTLQKFQFPWRFLSVSITMTAILAGIVTYLIPDKHKKAILVFVVLVSILITSQYWKPKSFQQKEESFYSGIYDSTTDTGESAPIWSVRFMEKRPIALVEIIEGAGEVSQISRNSTSRSYKVNSSSGVRVRENTLYFPGWEVRVDGVLTEIQFQDPSNRGLITFFVEDGDHRVDVLFKDTKLRSISNLVSIFSLVILIIIFIESKSKFISLRFKK